MNLTAEEEDGLVYFRICTFNPKYIPVFKMCYYLEDDRGFYKTYPADYPFIGLIRQNFVQNGEAMFDQLGYYSAIPWEEGLSAFANRIAGKGISWWLTGSCAPCLRGILINPHDVDIMVNSSDIPAIIEIFKEDIFEPIVDTQGWVTKHFGVLFMNCRIDIASDPASFVDEPEPVDFGQYAKAHLESIDWQGHQILVPPLHLSIAVNKKRERWDRVMLMQEFQAKTQS
jgi:hypothetical protein